MHLRLTTTRPRDTPAPPPPCTPVRVRRQPRPSARLSTRPVPGAPAPPRLHGTSSTSGTPHRASLRKSRFHLTRASAAVAGSVLRAASLDNRVPRNLCSWSKSVVRRFPRFTQISCRLHSNGVPYDLRRLHFLG